MKQIFLILALAASIALPAHGTAQDVLGPDHALYFSAGWRTNEPSPQNVLQLGIVFRCGVAWCIEYEEFPGKDNLPRTPLPYRHEMVAPYGTHRCTDEHLTTIHGVTHSDVSVQLIENERGFVLRTVSYEYTWERDKSPAGGFALVQAGGANNVVFEQPVGFAYESEDLTGRQVRLDDLIAYFNGQVAHKDGNKGVMDDWLQKETTLNLRKFSSSSIAPLMGLDYPGLPNIVQKTNKPMMWQHHSVLIPPTTSGRLNYILHEYGHDFNVNGCFDEFGHNKLMLPILRGGLISALVFIEYDPDLHDGVPMITVGRYFRKQ